MGLFNPPGFIRKLLACFLAIVFACPSSAQAQPAGQAIPGPRTLPLPLVAVHVSELTQALEKLPAAGTDTPQSPAYPYTSGTQWYYTSWHYFVIYESLLEALRSDGTPFVTVSDAKIAAGALRHGDGSPKYPILISLAAEAVADSEIVPLQEYVKAGGFLFAGSSAFTRFPDGRTRRNFALGLEMGLSMTHPSLQNWHLNKTFKKVGEHRLTAHIPAGALSWNMPLSASEVPWGTTYYGHPLHGAHYDFQVRAAGAQVIAEGSQGPLLAVKPYGSGQFIYHGDFQPLIGFGGPDSGMYAYGIYRNAIQWAFEAANLPLVRLSPWRYPYDSAFILRHDLEDSAGQAIEGSAKAEFEAGARGDYYFTTGTLREQLKNDPGLIVSLRKAVSKYGATIGPHNGGLKNPNSAKLTPGMLDYWHWGPDEAINGTQAGYDYAFKSLRIAYEDIERWLKGLDNGRPGCGAAGNCPRIWVSPYFNSTSEEANEILSKLGVLSMGEQKLGPFPHFTLSTRSEGLIYPQVTLPVSDWYIGDKVAQSIESGHSVFTMRALVDFYYDLGALVALYGHSSSASGLTNAYMKYSLSKPRMWAANSVMIADWWRQRAQVTVAPSARQAGGVMIAGAAVRGASDPEAAVEIAIPYWRKELSKTVQVWVDGTKADPDSYRFTNSGVKVRVGGFVSSVEIRYVPQEAGNAGNFQQAAYKTQPEPDLCWLMGAKFSLVCRR